MFIRIRFYGILAAFFLLTRSFAQSPSYTQYVDPFIGTGGHGHTFPGATLPFGMVQLSPDTRLEGWDGCSGYHYSDSVIYGFSHTHLSGTGVPDYCDILFMPTVGKPVFQNTVNGNYRVGYASHFRKSSEIAAPGYYAVHLDDDNINVELTATTRVGYHKYVYPATDQANIIIDLTHRDQVLDSYLKIIDSRHIEGYRRSQGWAQNEVVYFYAELSKPMDRFAIAMNDSIVKGITEARGKNVKACLQFHTSNQEAIYAKVALSFTGMNEAMRNLQSECPTQSFEVVKKNADGAWNAALSKIDVRGGTIDERKIFYTALYHCMIAPNITSDEDGSYLGRDFKVHKTSSKYYSVFSLWDTFRALHPLMTIIAPDRDVDFIKTFLLEYDQGGMLPVWELCSNETNCMIGYHSVSVIADAAAKNLTGFDLQHALDAMKNSASQNDSGLNALRSKGFIGMNDDDQSVSKTLEYAYDDWCIAQVAKLLNDTSDYRTYIQLAQSWKNIFNPSNGFMQPRNNGLWRYPFDPSEVNFNYTEANAWQYSFFVPQDIQTLISMMGGADRFDRKLDSLFSVSSQTSGMDLPDVSGMIGQYAHGNEPSHHLAYLYDYIGKPWKTQKLVRKIMDSLYRAAPDGLAGNEDCGQMSAWYVMNALGIYQVTPGSPYYAVGSPLFDSMYVHLDNGKTFVIISHNNSIKNIFIQSMKINGHPADSFFISHKMILSGNRIDFEMNGEPNYALVNMARTSPPSAIHDFPIVIVPAIEASQPFFTDSSLISFSSPQNDVKFFYTMDGTLPTEISALFVNLFSIHQTTTIRVVAVNAEGEQSKVVSGTFTRLTHNWNVNYTTHYDAQYNGGGDFALMDGIAGSNNFRDGSWQGWQGKDMQVTIDLGEEQKISEANAEFLQDADSWILMPKSVTVETSEDGVHFEVAGKTENKISDRDETPQHQLLAVKFRERHARYVRITAENYGTLPSWHRGSGGDAWVFCDEIFIQ